MTKRRRSSGEERKRRRSAGHPCTATRKGTAMHIPEYKVTEGSAVVHTVTHKEGTFFVEVRTSGWVEIEGVIYGWDTVVKDIPLHRISEPTEL